MDYPADLAALRQSRVGPKTRQNSINRDFIRMAAEECSRMGEDKPTVQQP